MFLQHVQLGDGPQLPQSLPVTASAPPQSAVCKPLVLFFN